MNQAAFLLFSGLFAVPAWAGSGLECRDVRRSLAALSNPLLETEERSRVGSCLLRSHLDHSETGRTLLRILRDPSEDTLLKEDLIEALASSSLRRRIRLEGKLAPEMGQQEKDAVDRALSGAGSILAAARAVKTIEETIPVTSHENELIRALSEIALDKSAHVLLRSAAVHALERISLKTFESGLYEDKSIRLVRETLRTVAEREDPASFYLNAEPSYRRLAVAGLPGFNREVDAPAASIANLGSGGSVASGGRAISSVKGQR